MKRVSKVTVGILFFLFSSLVIFSQVKYPPQVAPAPFAPEKEVSTTSVKSQGNTGTCWSFSATSMLETQFSKSSTNDIDLSEMFTVRNIYIEKAKNYLLRQGKAQFSEGGLGHDVIRSTSLYGAMPDEAYSGLVSKSFLDHSKLIGDLKDFLDSIINKAPRPISSDWLEGYNHLLDEYLGAVPSEFNYKGIKYTPISFAKEILHFNADEYVNITSFSHHPFYSSFILEVPDNFSNGSYNNIPAQEMIEIVWSALQKGYSVLWDTDVSNDNFRQQTGIAIVPDADKNRGFEPQGSEIKWDAASRQQLFENLTTQDDHLMHIVGIEKTKNGKRFFKVKNSWGNIGPYQGYIMVSETYFAINTVSIVVPKAAISKNMLAKMGVK